MTVAFQNQSFLSGGSTASTSLQSGGVTAATLYDTEALDRRYDYMDQKESYEVAYEGRDSAIESNISNIGSYLAHGEEDKALDAYNALLEEMSGQARYSQLISETGDDAQLRSVARKLIEEEIGTDLEEFIRDNARANSGVETQSILWAGNCDKTSREDLLNEMCNLDEEEKHANIFSKVGSGLLAILTIPFDKIFGDGTKH